MPSATAIPSRILKITTVFSTQSFLSFFPNSEFVSVSETAGENRMYSKLHVFRIILFKGSKVFYTSWFLARPGTRGKNKKLRGPSHFLANYNVFQQHRYSGTKQVHHGFVPIFRKPKGKAAPGSAKGNSLKKGTAVIL